MAAYALNEHAVEHARELIDARQYVLRSVWNEVQPSAADENAFLETHSWDEYSAWHLGLTEGAADETKARYAFVVGDFRRIHRMGLIACHYRAAEWRHKEIELAAHELSAFGAGDGARRLQRDRDRAADALARSRSAEPRSSRTWSRSPARLSLPASRRKSSLTSISTSASSSVPERVTTIR